MHQDAATDAEVRRDKIKLVRQAQQSIDDNNNLKSWAPIPLLEKKVKSDKFELTQDQKHCDSAQRHLEEQIAKLSEVDEQSQGRDEITKIQTEKRALHSQIMEFEEYIKSANNSRVEVKKKYTHLERAIVDLENDIKGFKIGLARCQDDATKRDVEKKEGQLADINVNKEAIEIEKEGVKVAISEAKAKIDQNKSIKDKAYAALENERRSKFRIKREIDDYHGRMKNRSVTFGKHVPTVDDLIKKQTWKGHVPIGPMGRHINVKPKYLEYAGLVEHLTGKLLKGMF